MPDMKEAQSSSVALYDTTLRDGTQRKGISLSVADKLKIVGLLDRFGIPYLECGWPGSNPKDFEFFQRARQIELGHAKLVAFGSTRRRDSAVEDDANIKALVDAETPVVALVGKSWALHVEKVINTTRDENLSMIFDSVKYMKSLRREVVYDAEHFFDGYRADPAYALSTLAAAADAGADWIVLCDTNGGSLPSFVAATVNVARSFLRDRGATSKLGIHTHNDSELAVANSLAAVSAGCEQVQGTINGYGERCGNANLVSIIPNLQLKMGVQCVPAQSLAQLTDISRKVAEIVNLSPDSQAPYVGSSAFAHKGGIHVAAVEKVAESYEHIDPAVVGNRREIVVSELAGRGNIRVRAGELDVRLEGIEGAVLDHIKRLESKGFQFEHAEGSFELILRRSRPGYSAPFAILDMMVVSDNRSPDQAQVHATVKVKVGDRIMHTASDGSGPVHALDGALRKGLEPFYPDIHQIRLTDYKVRILDPESATAAITRVLIEAAHEQHRWTTVGCSENIIQASFMALADSFEYFLARRSAANPAKAA
jgi:2-isopropylmalate synthase